MSQHEREGAPPPDPRYRPRVHRTSRHEPDRAPPFSETGYDPAASVYDLEYPECAREELTFWSELARAAGPRLLELAVGSGRVAIALARLGLHVTGLDASSEMLARARDKRSRLPAETAARLRLVNGDMREFELDERFDLVFLAFNAYLLLPDEASRVRCLTTAARHLRPGGTIAIDAFAAAAIDQEPDHERLEFLERDPSTARRVTRERFYAYDPATQRGLSTLVYRFYAADESVEERRLGYSLALLSRDDVVREFEQAGLHVDGVYGTYARDAWRPDAPNLLVVARCAPR